MSSQWNDGGENCGLKFNRTAVCLRRNDENFLSCTQISDMNSTWKPTASIKVLQLRAQLYKDIRRFFEARQVLEVETPILGVGATVDPFIDSLSTEVMGELRYLQTSPEFYLKRLLAAGTQDIYSLGKVFRQGEKGRRHSPEFTLLEWYRIEWDEHQLMSEVEELMALLLPSLSIHKVSYRELFLQYLDVDPHTASINTLQTLATTIMDVDINSDRKDTWLDVLMTHCIEPQLPDGLCFIYDYPASQAALAKLARDKQGQMVARRFELYLNRIELANGYFELTDAVEQEQRFQHEQAYRRHHNLPDLPYDQKLVDALKNGMPNCAGVALGVDRLLMVLSKAESIEQVISFA